MSLLFSFAGRIGRGKFWLSVLFQFLLGLVAIGLMYALVPWDQIGLIGPDGQPVVNELGQPQVDLTNPGLMPVWIISGLWILLSTWWSLAGAVKRFHDRGKSGWWVLIILVPIVGGIWWLVDLGILEGEEGENRWGPNPVPQTD